MEEAAQASARGEVPDLNRIRLKLADCAGDLSKLFGVPAENVMNLTAATARQVLMRTLGRYMGEYQSLKLTADPGSKSGAYYDLLYRAMENDREAYEAIYRDMVDSGRFTPEKIRSAMETRMKREQGVTSAAELDSRYLSPDQEQHYDRVMSELEDSRLWRSAGEGQRERAGEILYGLSTDSASGRVHRERAQGGAEYGITEGDYVLFRLALELADRPNASGNLGTYTNEEAEEAIAMLEGLSDEARSYLWSTLGKSEKSDPWDNN